MEVPLIYIRIKLTRKSLEKANIFAIIGLSYRLYIHFHAKSKLFSANTKKISIDNLRTIEYNEGHQIQQPGDKLCITV